MRQKPNFSIAAIITRVLCVVVCFYGLKFGFEMIGAFWNMVRHPDWSILFGLVCVVIMISFCGLGIYIAVRAWTLQSATAVRWLVGSSIFMSLFVVYSRVEAHYRSDVKSGADAVRSACEAIIAIFAAFVYGWIVRWILSRLDLTDGRSLSQRELAAKNIFGLLGFFLWMGLSDATMQLVPKEKGFQYAPQEPWGIVALIGPILVAALVYKLGVWASTHQIQKVTPVNSLNAS